MTVAYLETSQVAHFMDWHDDGFEAACPRFRKRIRGRDYRGRDWPIRHAAADAQPSKPWCRLCVARLQSRIDYWLETVPPLSEGARS